MNKTYKMEADSPDIITEEIIAHSKKLRLQVIEGVIIKPGTIIDINAGGLVGSKRKSKDGYAYFGTENKKVIIFSIYFYRMT